MSRLVVGRNTTLLTTAACAAVAALALSACSSSSSSSSSAGGNTSKSAAGGSTSASACVSNASAYLKPFLTIPTTLPAQFTPLSKKPAPGKKVIFLASSIPYEQVLAKSAQQAAAAVGWTSRTINFAPTVEDVNAKFQQAISDKPDVILFNGWPIAAVRQSVAAAKAAGILVVDSAVTDEPTGSGTTGFAATSDGPASYQQTAKILASWVLQDSNCNANVATFSLPYAVFSVQNAQFVKTLKAACPSCKASYHLLQNTAVGTSAATTAIVSAIQADPSIKYVNVVVGTLASGLSAALKQGGLSGVKIVGEGPAAADYAALRNGSEAMWVASSAPINAWDMMDAALRVFDTGKPFPGFVEPNTMLTSSNVPANASDTSAYPANYVNLYKTLWKVNGQ